MWSADIGADTLKKQGSYHKPVWLTLAEHVQTPHHARVPPKHLETGKELCTMASMATPVQSAQQLGSQTDQV